MLYNIYLYFTVSAIVGMGCTSSSQCTDVLANTTCLLSQCACVSGYIGTTCTGKTTLNAVIFCLKILIGNLLDDRIVSLKMGNLLILS